MIATARISPSQPLALPGRKTASGGLRPWSRRRVGRSAPQATDAPGKMRPGYGGARRRSHLPQSGKSHKYTISRSTLCSANDAFNEFKAPGMSAPGAPRATEGFTPRINLAPFGDPISQTVNSGTRTITNTTLPGHIFYPGQVQIQVTPNSGGGSTVTITGTGNGGNVELNYAAGYGFFGTAATEVMQACNMAAGVVPPVP